MTEKTARRQRGFLSGARAYLSGPMDYVASREQERLHGWRNRVGDFLRHFGVVVFDPWDKPEVRGLHEYGREDVRTTRIKERWTFEDSPRGAKARAHCSGVFWETLHIDLRMVDTSDFTIAYCPTNIYSVGTVHEIILCREQRKPVFFVSPQIVFPAFASLREYLKEDNTGSELLDQLATEIPVKQNAEGVPSLWYMSLVGGERFFDGFGFRQYRRRFGWDKTPFDDREDALDLKRPLLPFLESLDQRLPKKWDNRRNQYVRDDDLLLWDLRHRNEGGAQVFQPHTDRRGTRI